MSKEVDIHERASEPFKQSASSWAEADNERGFVAWQVFFFAWSPKDGVFQHTLVWANFGVWRFWCLKNHNICSIVVLTVIASTVRVRCLVVRPFVLAVFSCAMVVIFTGALSQRP